MTELITTPETEESDVQRDYWARPLAYALDLDWEKIAYLALIALTLITRLWGLGERVMSHDESLHTQFSLQYFRGDGYNHTPLMHGPFLFHITAFFYWLFGASDFSARLPVALFGVVLVAMPYFLRQWLGRVGALVTSFLFLISPFITYYSRYIRHDIYVIVWAMIVFIATWYYLRAPKEKHLWWFAAALALMFATKEVSFIYVAIFGSFLVLRLATRLWQTEWFRLALPRLIRPALVLAAALVLLGGGFFGVRAAANGAAESVESTPEEGQGFAADPDAETEAVTPAATESSTTRLFHWLQVAGALGIGLAVFLGVRELRPRLDESPEFDLIALYSTLILPSISPLLVVLAGYNPTDYTINRCELAGQATMTSVELFLGRATNAVCWSAFLSSNVVITGIFVVVTLIVSALVGLWWRRRQWIIAAVIFHAIFLILYSSVFTNPGGWASGTVGSLGYWLEQQEVQRGSQPWFYYFFVVPFYEFLPLIFSLLAIRLWSIKQGIGKAVGYWTALIVGVLLTYSLGNWIINRPAVLAGEAADNTIALVLAAALLGAGTLYWFLVQGRPAPETEEERVDPLALVAFIPSVIWWLLLTWVAYSVAGEKMPWLSTHFVIPMALLAGWYAKEKLAGIGRSALLSRNMAVLVGVVLAFLAAAFLAIRPLLLGQIRFGEQGRQNLTALGSFLGVTLGAAALFYLVRLAGKRVGRPLRRRAWLVAIFILLSALTIRFSYMASWPNADYATEFLVYAHAAPAVKDPVMTQIEELSMRLHGDKSVKVAWGDDGTWPMQWYLKDYPNRFFAGKQPTAGITDYPVVVVGSRNWNEFEAFLDDDDYQKQTLTFLWWPMEKYRDISWSAVFGRRDFIDETGSTTTGRGILDADVRQALWDIFFYRDYEKYGEVFGGSYRVGEWPLRADLRLYIRRDVLANLWDYGVRAAGIEPPVDPYALGELQLTPNLVLGSGGLQETELRAPRNLTIGPDDNLYVLDSGNHRVVVFDREGAFLRTWGEPGSAPGQFNEPWGIAVDDEHVFVADTWNHRVQKFTLEGDLVTTFGESGTVADVGQDSGGFFFGPRSLTLLPSDRLLVTDTGNHRLQLFDRDGNFIEVIGGQGTQPGSFNEPVGMQFGDEHLYLADTWNARIQRFNEALLPDLQWPIDGWEGDSTENKPYLAVDSAGNVYATDPENYRVLIFSPTGQYLGRFGRQGTGLDQFGLPNGIAVDADDNVYLTDATNNRVLRFPAPDLSGPPPGAAEPVDEFFLDESESGFEELPAEPADDEENAPAGGGSE